ncbi:MAG TPA: ATP-binding protein, partial [Thermodesulfobacteriota bacterium]
PPRFRGIKNVKDDPDKVYTSKSSLQLGRPLEALASKLRDPRFDFLFNPGPWHPDTNGQPKEDLDTLLKAWVGGDKPISILDLSGIPPLIQIELVGALLRIIYDALFWARDLAEGGRERPLLIVMEEAHTYLGKDGGASSSVLRIVKEGRKYGIGAMIVSQRPSEIDSSILSQCGTIIAMRLSNETDRGQVKSAAADNLADVLSMLPVLRTGEAIIVGESVHLPTRAIIDRPPLNRRPSSSDPLIYEKHYPGGWNNPKFRESNYSEVVYVWRKQQPRSPRIVLKSIKKESK